MIVSLSSVCDRNMVLQAANTLSSFEKHVFATPALSHAEVVLEKKLLKKRWELISSGEQRKDIKIRNLKLFLKREQVSIDSD